MGGIQDPKMVRLLIDRLIKWNVVKEVQVCSVSIWPALKTLTSIFANLPVTLPENADKGGPVMGGGLDVAELPEEDMASMADAVKAADGKRTVPNRHHKP